MRSPKTKADDLLSVSFECRNGGFTAFLSVEDLLSIAADPEPLLSRAAHEYEQAIQQMRLISEQIDRLRSEHRLVPARTVWQLGDVIFRLMHELARLSLKPDRLYEHLNRDVALRPKRLEKIVTLRRYVPQEELIPEQMSWGKLEKGTRKAAERLRAGLPLK